MILFKTVVCRDVYIIKEYRRVLQIIPAIAANPMAVEMKPHKRININYNIHRVD